MVGATRNYIKLTHVSLKKNLMQVWQSDNQTTNSNYLSPQSLQKNVSYTK